VHRAAGFETKAERLDVDTLVAEVEPRIALPEDLVVLPFPVIVAVPSNRGDSAMTRRIRSWGKCNTMFEEQTLAVETLNRRGITAY
jgi:hypothetical protein